MIIKYVNWDSKPKEWNTETARFYLLIDHQIDGADGSYFSHSAPFHANTPSEVRAELTQWLVRFPAYTLDLFRSAGARIVKAPCAFDAREQNIFVENI